MLGFSAAWIREMKQIYTTTSSIGVEINEGGFKLVAWIQYLPKKVTVYL